MNSLLYPRLSPRCDPATVLSTTFDRCHSPVTTPAATPPGSVLVKMGRTTVLCTCCVEKTVPEFLLGKGKGWLTAEYGMLPGSTGTRKPREKAGKIDGRSVEIQRLIGRSLRAVVNLDKLGERTLWIDATSSRLTAARERRASTAASSWPWSTP